MIPGVANLNLYRGDYYGWRVRLWTDLARTVPYNLTGYTVAAQWRNGAQVVDFVVVVTMPNIIDLSITAAKWTGAPTAGAWDLQITDSAGRPYTPVGGTVSVTADVTA